VGTGHGVLRDGRGGSGVLWRLAGRGGVLRGPWIAGMVSLRDGRVGVVRSNRETRCNHNRPS